jgi:ABC-type molybdate transport system permease subunit
MPPQLDLLVALLELATFFLVTSEVLGRRRLEAAFRGMDRLNAWLRTVWFSADFGPIPPGSVVLLVVLGGFVAAALLGYDLPRTQTLVGTTLAAVLVVPAAFVLVYLVLHALQRRERLGRVLAIIGACLFVTGRAIVIASAYHRLPG